MADFPSLSLWVGRLWWLPSSPGSYGWANLFPSKAGVYYGSQQYEAHNVCGYVNPKFTRSGCEQFPLVDGQGGILKLFLELLAGFVQALAFCGELFLVCSYFGYPLSSASTETLQTPPAVPGDSPSLFSWIQSCLWCWRVRR